MLRRSLAAILFVAMAPLVGCQDTKDMSFCEVYAEMLDQREAMKALDPATLDAQKAADVVEDYLGSVRQLRQVSDDRYEAEIDALEVAVNDVLLTLESVEDQADYKTWAPLVEDDLKAAQDAADTLDAAIGTSCEAATTTGS